MMSKTIVYFLGLLMLVSCGLEESSSGDLLFEEGKYELAIEEYNDYLATHPEHVKTLYNRGRSYEELGKYEEATNDFLKLIEIDPGDINAYLSLSKISYNLSNYNKALIYANKAVKINENSARAHFLYARSAHQMGNFTQALDSYNNAITIDRDFGEAFLYRGALKIGLEKQRSACEDFNFAVLLNVEGAKKAKDKYCN